MSGFRPEKSNSFIQRHPLIKWNPTLNSPQGTLSLSALLNWLCTAVERIRKSKRDVMLKRLDRRNKHNVERNRPTEMLRCVTRRQAGVLNPPLVCVAEIKRLGLLQTFTLVPRWNLKASLAGLSSPPQGRCHSRLPVM